MSYRRCESCNRSLARFHLAGRDLGSGEIREIHVCGSCVWRSAAGTLGLQGDERRNEGDRPPQEIWDEVASAVRGMVSNADLSDEDAAEIATMGEDG